ncbi:mitochondrial Complex I (CI) NADH:ubiquinone oxidoreductase subunit 13-kDa/NUMM/NDUFS6 [Andalucia godoyi]|uniref:Mitochondrial Complex I (CI) NADH:ubiquinone oxidoreductase subunit 13-kDa/NUMM/NDUFS6 n=1 Tax=Andalucia godoyi TaxID=505711 RepID=A0A8K0AIM6_ANDGO|nr:mitochondrial Complex I (CI) NADH:ubiquinone oxidoreductase subunit 13-kDa/NUMM/NDUFS6 [Andalucia godoyi]|eukprot:ANDGO_01704.mRNA.1 mitochondrial Complex I (CI) NADH:ubiquinone oxidoreductase subunit 13-kDa/NUMM/NDUFS6
MFRRIAASSLRVLPCSRTSLCTPLFRPFSSLPRPADSAGVEAYKPAQEFIKEVPVQEVDAAVARCDGGPRPEMGHPVEFIKLTDGVVAVCKYCGLRYARKGTYNAEKSRVMGH